MPIGDLARDNLDAALAADRSHAEREGRFEGSDVAQAQELAAQRGEILDQIDELVLLRRAAVSVANDTRETAAAQTDVAEGAEELSSIKQTLGVYEIRRDQLRAKLAEQNEALEQARKRSAQKDAELAAKIGEATLASPDLPDAIRGWAQKFATLELTETKAFFELEAARFDEIERRNEIKAEIREVDARLKELPAQIDRQSNTLAALRAEVQEARGVLPAQQAEVERIQHEIDDKKSTLGENAHFQRLYDDLVRYADELTVACQAAANELESEVAGARRVFADLPAGSLSKKLKPLLEPIESAWDDLIAACATLCAKRPLRPQLAAMDEMQRKAQALAKRTDAFLTSGDLADYTATRRFEHARKQGDRIYEAVRLRLNGEEERENLQVAPGKFYADTDALREVAALADSLSLTVLEQHLQPLVLCAEQFYAKERGKLLQALQDVIDEAAEAERQAGIDAIGREPEFVELIDSWRETELTKLKKQPADEVNRDVVLAALRGVLAKQKRPTPARWCRLLDLPFGENDFFEAAPFKDAKGNSFVVHISVFSDCFSEAAKGQVGVMKTPTEKHTAREVIDKLFVNKVSKTKRVHASIELKDKGGNQPHVYYRGNTLHFPSVFRDRVESEPDHDAKWVASARSHARKQINKFMAEAEGMIALWLKNNGRL